MMRWFNFPLRPSVVVLLSHYLPLPIIPWPIKKYLILKVMGSVYQVADP